MNNYFKKARKPGSGQHVARNNLSEKIHPTKLIAGKLEFIKTNFPEFQNVDPYLDIAFVNKVKKAMTDAGHYSKLYYQADGGINSAVINLIKRAKNESVHNFKPTKRRSRAQKVY